MSCFKRLVLLVPALCLKIGVASAVAQQTEPSDWDMPRPIEAHESVFLEELTWLEVRDALRSGMTTVIVPTGGIEPNGPYLALGKHNYILRATTDRIARKLRNALVSPIVPFVPEGDIDPPTGHMRYPGTISVSNETFMALLVDIASSLRAHGFQHIILIGDSGPNQEGMKQVAEHLATRWTDGQATIHYIPEYYDNPRWNTWLAERGVKEVNEGLHDDVRHSSIMMTIDPLTVRMPQRVAAGCFSINGVELAPAAKTIALGNELVDYQADVTVAAILRAIANRP
jgi:creatinine amidohydrolase/Fe(II)-dependent formamide hydrolase-like protein